MTAGIEQMSVPFSERNDNMDLVGSDHSSSSQDGNSRELQGNLQSALSSYDRANSNMQIDSRERSSTFGSINLNLDLLQRERSSTLGSIRERSFTFGSEFDLGLGWGPLGNDSGSHQVMDAGGGSGSTTPRETGNVVSISSSSGNSVTNNQTGLADNVTATNSPTCSPSLQSQQQQFGMTSQQQSKIKAENSNHLGNESGPLPFPGMQYINYGSGGNSGTVTSLSLGTTLTGNVPTLKVIPGNSSAPNSASNSGPPSQASSQGSTSGFLSGMFGTSTTTESGLHSGGTKQNQISVAHTPPSALGSSFENRHFGKRMRAGSISGRLRSMSDLEDKGLIDRNQKGILKDLVISGDDALQKALDRYEKGDTSQLENMIKSGVLNNKMCSDIDILGDLDLDFLNMNEDFSNMDGGILNTNMGGTSQTTTKSMPIPVNQSSMNSQSIQHSNPNSGRSTPRSEHVSSSSHLEASQAAYADDGIGDLDFNGEYEDGTETDEYLHLSQENNINSQLQAGSLNHPGSSPRHHDNMNSTVTSQSASATGIQNRFRTNSLAFGALLNDSTQPENMMRSRSESGTDIQGRYRANSLAFGGFIHEINEDDQSIGKWMDRTPNLVQGGEISSKSKPIKNGLPPTSVVGANGGFYIVNEEMMKVQNPSKKAQGLTTAALNKLQKRREKEEKKAQKERLKLEKKAMKDKEMRDKKEKDAKDKREKKEMKAALSKLKHDEKKKTKSGNTSALKRDYTPKKKREEDHETDENDEAPKEIVSGTGRPRSLSDPNLSIGLDDNGLMHVDGPPDWIGAYSPESRKMRIERFLAKRNHRVWVKKVKYDVRKNFADSRLRVKGRFVKKEDELLMRDLMSLT